MTDAAFPLARASAGAGLEQLMSRPLGDADLDSATAALAAPLERRSESRLSILAFRAGGEILAVRALDTAKVVPCSPIHRVPHRRSPVFLGIANHDGELLLCMSIERAMGLADPAAGSGPADAPTAMVVIESGRERWAFPVQTVIGVSDVDHGSLRPPPVTVSAARSGCARALLRIPEGDGMLLDAEALASIFRGATA